MSLEDPFWDAMKEIAALKDMTVSELISQIDANRKHSNLSSTIRLFILDYYMSRMPVQAAKLALLTPRVLDLHTFRDRRRGGSG